MPFFARTCEQHNEVITSDGLEILHFPMRTREQFENKIKNGGAAYERNTKLPPTVARGWRKLYGIYQAQGSLEGYFREHCFRFEQIGKGLEDGSLMIDTRLADFFNTASIG